MDEEPWYETVSTPALLRHARTTYATAMRGALEAAGYDDIPANGLYVIGALALDREVEIRQILRELRLTREAAAELVKTLVVRGYLERAATGQTPDTLTERGRAAAAVQGAARERIDSALVARIGAADMAAARRALGTLIDMAREERAEA